MAVPDLVPPDELATIRKAYDRIFKERAGREAGNHFDLAGTDEEGVAPRLPQILDPGRYAPEIREGVYRARCETIAKQLIGEDATLGGEHAILKPARSGAETPWHQDEAYWEPSLDYRSLSIWIPLQEATVENGCMHFVPGSQSLDVLEHRSVGGDVRVHALEALGAEVTGAVPCPIPAGGCTVHACRTLHYAGPNTTDQPRRALIVIAGAPAKSRSDQRRFPWNEDKCTARAERARRAANQR